MRVFYLCLAVLGFVLPYGAFLPWLVTNGPDINLFFQKAFSHQISAFAWLDIIVAAIALIGFILVPILEENLRTLVLLSFSYDESIAFVFKRPAFLVLLVLFTVTGGSIYYRRRKAKKGLVDGV